MDTAGDRISEPEYRSVENTQTESQREAKKNEGKKNRKQRPCRCDTQSKCHYICTWSLRNRGKNGAKIF